MKTPPAFPLLLAAEESTVRVVAIRGGPGLTRRLGDMGLNVGAEITVGQRRGAGLVVVRGFALSLRKAEADALRVEKR